MPDKFTKAVAVTPNDGADLATMCDGIYIGEGDYTDNQAIASLAGDAGEPVLFVRGEDPTSVTTRGVTSWYLDNDGSAGSAIDPLFKSSLGASIPTLESTDPKLNYKQMVTFTGDNYLESSDNAGLDFDGDFSVVMLVKWTDIASNNEEVILAKDNINSEWMLYKTSSHLLKVSADGSDPSSGLTVANDTWYIIEWSRSSGTQTIYVDGVNLGSTSSNSTDFSSSDNLLFGVRNSSGTYNRYFTGSLAFCAIWENATLSAADRIAVNNYLPDRYLTTPQVDVAVVTSVDASSVTTKRLKRGTVHPLAIKRVMATGTAGSSIVALYE